MTDININIKANPVKKVEHPRIDEAPTKKMVVSLNRVIMKDGYTVSLRDFISRLMITLDSIPEEQQPSATIGFYIDSDSNDEERIAVSIFYTRDETREEKNRRLLQIEAAELARRKGAEEEDRKLYEALKKRFEGGA